MDVIERLGGIDIYLLDQVMRRRVAPGSRVLDAGCGHGRNLRFFLESGYDVYGLDADVSAVAAVRRLAAELGAPSGEERFRAEAVEDGAMAAGAFDLVVCNAVLHFARDEEHLRAMVAKLVAWTRPGGLGFVRLASTIGIERLVDPPEGAIPRRVRLPDGSSRLVVDLDYLLALTDEHGLELADPIKTVNVQNLRAMTNWVWRRRGGLTRDGKRFSRPSPPSDVTGV